MTLDKAGKIIERLLELAALHGLDSEPDHEVGDLQDLLRAVWKLLPLPRMATLMKSEEMRQLRESWGVDEELNDLKEG